MKTILIKLSGPLQAWGTKSYFEKRKTDNHPSKSAIVGMLMCCAGYGREDTEIIKKYNSLEFAVRVDSPGFLLRDFHTAHKYKKDLDMDNVYRGECLDRTYLTNRYYLEDATFLVGISHEDDTFIDNIYEDLRYPYYQPYMGRKSLPLVGNYLEGIYNESILDLMINYPLQANNWEKKRLPPKVSISLYGDENVFLNCEKDLIKSYRRDRAISFSKKDRKYGFRNECRMDISVDNMDSLECRLNYPKGVDSKTDENDEHDIFLAIGGSDVSI